MDSMARIYIYKRKKVKLITSMILRQLNQTMDDKGRLVRLIKMLIRG